RDRRARGRGAVAPCWLEPSRGSCEGFRLVEPQSCPILRGELPQPLPCQRERMPRRFVRYHFPPTPPANRNCNRHILRRNSFPCHSAARRHPTSFRFARAKLPNTSRILARLLVRFCANQTRELFHGYATRGGRAKSGTVESNEKFGLR